jgi:hypothetical protein
LIDEVPGDFSDGRTLAPAMLAVRVEIDGNVWGEDRGWGPIVDSSQGRWATVDSMLKAENGGMKKEKEAKKQNQKSSLERVFWPPTAETIVLSLSD